MNKLTPTQFARAERVGRYFIVRIAGAYELHPASGEGDALWAANKKDATDKAWRLTRKAAEAERRAAH